MAILSKSKIGLRLRRTHFLYLWFDIPQFAGSPPCPPWLILEEVLLMFRHSQSRQRLFFELSASHAKILTRFEDGQ